MADDRGDQPITTQGSEKRKPAAHDGNPDFWLLEDVYPDTDQILGATQALKPVDSNVLVVLDTNVLLLPFSVGSQDFPKIAEVYSRLIKEGRLFIPKRVLREYVKNRDAKLAELLQTLKNRNSQLAVPKADMPPLLGDLGEAEGVKGAAKALEDAKRAYLDQVDNLSRLISGWRGNDPVTAKYLELFSPNITVEPSEDRDIIEEQWLKRLSRQIPPGYKDASKSDAGIGDFLIWLTILRLGRERKQNLIFVTGEEKPDWLVNSIYPRPELIDEYRRHSDGKTLELSKLADLLAKMNVPESVVDEVRQAETDANSAPTVLEAFETLDRKHSLQFAEWAQNEQRYDEVFAKFGSDRARGIARPWNRFPAQTATFPIHKNGVGFIVLPVDNEVLRLRFVVTGEGIFVRGNKSEVRLGISRHTEPGTRLREVAYVDEAALQIEGTDDVFVIESVSGALIACRLMGKTLDDNEIIIRYRRCSHTTQLIAP